MKFKKILAALMSAICITAFFTQPNVYSAAIKGDANGNGVIDLEDAILIAKFIINPKTMNLEQQKAADYNGDNKVDLQDAVCIAKYLLKNTPSVTTAAKVTTKRTTTTVKITTKTTTKKVVTTKKITTTKKAATTVKQPTGSIGVPTVDISNAKYILNTSTKKFHYPKCSSVSQIAASNIAGANDRADIINAGYSPCKKCNP